MSASRLKYEKPMLVAFQDSEAHMAHAVCSPTGNSDAGTCWNTGGHAGTTCLNGDKAGQSCSPFGGKAFGGSCQVGDQVRA